MNKELPPNFREAIQHNPETAAFLGRFIEWTKVARAEGFPTRLFDSMIGAFSLDPETMTDLVNRSLSCAEHSLGQDRQHSIPATVFPLATALRVFANDHPDIWNKTHDPLSVKHWTARDVLALVKNGASEIAEMAGRHTMAKNVPQRAGFILDLLKTVPIAQQLEQEPLAFIELGASAGLIATALAQPLKFQRWLNSQQTVVPENRTIRFLPKDTVSIGIDLAVPTDDWAVACTDDDQIRDAVINFIANFPIRAPVFDGDALAFDKHPEVIKFLEDHTDAKPVVVLSMFLYQLPSEKRAVLVNQVRDFAIRRDALIVFADATSIIDGSSGWCAWVENGTGRISPIFNVQEEPILAWGGNLERLENVRSVAQLWTETPDQVGEEFASGLRETSNYADTQAIFNREGLTDIVLNKTPPVGVNLRILSEMPVMKQLRTQLEHTPLDAAILGLAIVNGVPDFKRFLTHALGTGWRELHVVDVDSNIFRELKELIQKERINGVSTIERDARDTGLNAASQDMVLRDHLGNCCPPEIDRTIDGEVARILKPKGFSIVNITTSEILPLSPNRTSIPFDTLSKMVGTNIMKALQTDVYDLAQLKRMFGKQWECLRGHLLEIEPEGGFVIFGEDTDGHGEWFRPIKNHLQLWEKNGFEVLEVKTREGDDSHVPPLRCRRHNVVMRKI